MLVECSESRVRSREDDGSSASDGEELDRGCDASTWLENPHASQALTVPHFEPSSGSFVIQFYLRANVWYSGNHVEDNLIIYGHIISEA